MTDLENVLTKRMRPAREAEGDFRGADGLLYCGRCGAPKEAEIDLSALGMGTGTKRVAASCNCVDAEISAKKERDTGERFAQEMERWEAAFHVSEPSYRRCTFAGDDSPATKISTICRRYVARWEKVRRDNIGILFYGSVGTGKSFYACAIANALLERQVPAAVTNFPRLLNILQGARDRQAVIDHLQRYELLALDDLGVERDTTYAAEQIFSVIDARARAKLPLIVTTNLTLDELYSPCSMQQQRIYDRVMEMCPVRLKLTGESRRAGNAAARRETALEILMDKK